MSNDKDEAPAIKLHMIVASFLAHMANEIGTGRMGAITAATMYIRGDRGKEGQPEAILTFPAISEAETIVELEHALAWMNSEDGSMTQACTITGVGVMSNRDRHIPPIEVSQ